MWLTGAALALCVLTTRSSAQAALSVPEAHALAAALGSAITERLRLEPTAPARALPPRAVPDSMRPILLRAHFGCEDERGQRCSGALPSLAREAADSSLRSTLRQSLTVQPYQAPPGDSSGTPTSGDRRQRPVGGCREAFAGAPIAIGVTNVRSTPGGFEVEWYRMNVSGIDGCESGGAVFETVIAPVNGTWRAQGTRVLRYY